MGRQRRAVVTTGVGACPKVVTAVQTGGALLGPGYSRCVPARLQYPRDRIRDSCLRLASPREDIDRSPNCATSAAPGLYGSKSDWAKIPGVDADVVLARHWLQPAMRMAVQVYRFLADLVPGAERVVAKNQETALDS